MKHRLIILLGVLMLSLPVISQEEEKTSYSFDFGADLMSRYVWRGLLYSPAVNAQPWMVFTKGNLSVGAWGSYALGNYYAEADFYISYAAGPVTISINNYYSEDETDMTAVNYFNFKSGQTGHYFEGSLAYTLPENFPLTITAATFFYGADYDYVADKNYYATYLELAYPFKFSETDCNAFIGGTVNEGIYAAKAAIVNMGLKASKSIKISNEFELPVSASLVINPYAEDIFFVFGFHF